MKLGLMLTDRCNFQCKHCMVDSKTENYTLADDKVINRFLEIVEYNKPEQVCIVGGEALLFLDEVESIVNKVRENCSNILIYSNGTFLLDENKRNRVKYLGVQVRISKTDYHKEFWNDKIQNLIDESEYIKIEALDKDMKPFPRGRAYTNKIYSNQTCPCSLVTEDYENLYCNNRVLVMMDGSVNIWCPCMALQLAHIFEDDVITYDLLVEREKLLREYLLSVNMLHDSMEFMCNQVCDRFVVTKRGIFRDDELMKKF